MTDGSQRWLRLASLHPESINYVKFFRDGKLYYTSYDEPFSVHFQSNWRQGGVKIQSPDEEWTATIHLRSGEILER